MKDFEQRLDRLEALGREIQKTDVPLEDALKAFEEGIKLARTLEEDLSKVESRVDLLVNPPQDSADAEPNFNLFNAG